MSGIPEIPETLRTLNPVLVSQGAEAVRVMNVPSFSSDAFPGEEKKKRERKKEKEITDEKGGCKSRGCFVWTLWVPRQS